MHGLQHCLCRHRTLQGTLFLRDFFCTFAFRTEISIFIFPSPITSLSFSDYVFLLIHFYPEMSEVIRPFHDWFPA
jgi:hypothetical protein